MLKHTETGNPDFILDGNQTVYLTSRIRTLRATQKGVEDIRGRAIIQYRIDHIKRSISNHCSCDFSETIVNHALSL